MGPCIRFPASTGYFTGDGVQVYQVGSITTTNGNAITFTYDPSNPRKLTSITDSTGRSITFAYTTFPNIFSGSDTVVTSMTANNRVYRYHYTTIDNKLFLTEAEPPVGPSWTYSYYPNSNALQRYLLETITYPTGAELTYQYGDVDFDVGPTVVTFRVVTRRSLSGRGLTSTSWTYAYAGNSGSSQVTTVTQSGCRTERYT
jgi:YD repeat-containing protein